MDTKTKKIIAAFKKQGARIETKARVKLKEKKDFSLWYTPGVGAASLHLWKHPEDAREMSIKKTASRSSPTVRRCSVLGTSAPMALCR